MKLLPNRVIVFANRTLTVTSQPIAALLTPPRNDFRVARFRKVFRDLSCVLFKKPTTRYVDRREIYVKRRTGFVPTASMTSYIYIHNIT